MSSAQAATTSGAAPASSPPAAGPGATTGTAGAAATAPPLGAFVPPIGIPEPSFGIREVAPAAPSPWTTETPGFYYVDQHAPAAADSRAYGTPAAPRQTIPASLLPGDVVEVHGVYDFAPMGYSNIDGAGTPARPIFVRGRSATEKPRFKRELHVIGSYVILENLEFADFDGTLCGQPVLLAPAHHVALRSSDIHGNLKDGGLIVASWSADRGHDLVVYGNFIHDNGDYRATFDQDRHGIAIGGVDHVWVLDNEITRNSGDGLQINAGSLAAQARTNHIYVGRNRSYRNKQSGMWTKQAVDVIFSQNRISDHRPSDSSPGAGTGFQYAPERVWFLYNDISDCEMGIFSGSDSGLGSGTDAYMIGNVIHDIHHSTGAYNLDTGWAPAAITAAGGKNIAIVDNTISDVDAGINTPLPGASLRIENNIISDVKLGSHVFIESMATAGASRLSHDLFSGAVRLRCGAGSARDLAAFRAAFPAIESGSLAADPLFVDPIGGDLQLRDGSPAIDAGAAPDAYAKFSALYGIDIAVDAAGNARTRGAGRDIGAYEKP